MKDRFCGYTLLEVVITLLIIAVVVAVSVRATKHNLDSILSLQYYSTYKTLKDVTEKMLADFRADDTYLSKHKPFFIPFAYAGYLADYLNNSSAEHFGCPNFVYYDLVADKFKTMSCGPAGYLSAEQIEASGCVKCAGMKPPYHASFGEKLDYFESFGFKSCYEGDMILSSININPPISTPTATFTDKGGSCNEVYSNNIRTAGAFYIHPSTSHTKYGRYVIIPSPNLDKQLRNLYCPDGVDSRMENVDGGYVCLYGEKQTPTDPSNPSYSCSGEKPCGMKCDTTTGNWIDDPEFDRTCPGTNEAWSEVACRCVPIPHAIPRTAKNFCQLFASYSNNKMEDCEGSKVEDNTIDFSALTPDIILHNGIKLYNLSKTPPRKFEILAGSKNTGSYEGVENTNEYGYYVYADIDGSNGDGILWYDVYPFYITLSGKVIPAYDTSDSAEETGGLSKLHLQVSVRNLLADASSLWILKSVSFKEGACASGYVGANTPYCTNTPATLLDGRCADEQMSDCRLKIIMPVLFWQ